MYYFSNALKSDIGVKLRNSASSNDVATFCMDLAAEKYLRFWNNMSQIFPGAKISYRDDLSSLSKQLE